MNQLQTPPCAVIVAFEGPEMVALVEALGGFGCREIVRVDEPGSLKAQIDSALLAATSPVLFFLSPDVLRQHPAEALMLSFELTSDAERIVPVLVISAADMVELELLQGQTGVETFIMASDEPGQMVPQLEGVLGRPPSTNPSPTPAEPEVRWGARLDVNVMAPDSPRRRFRSTALNAQPSVAPVEEVSVAAPVEAVQEVEEPEPPRAQPQRSATHPASILERLKRQKLK